MAERGGAGAGDGGADRRAHGAGRIPARVAHAVRGAAGRLSVRLFAGLLVAFSLCGVLIYLIVSLAFPYGFDSVIAAMEGSGIDVMRLDDASTLTFTETGVDVSGSGADAAVSITVAAQRTAIENTFVTLLLPMVGVIVALSAAVSWLCSRLIIRPMARANRRLADVNGRLASANDELARETRAMRAMERERRDFFAAASHELKTPVAVLHAQIEGMMMNIGDYADRDAVLPRALKTVERMQRIVGQTLAVSRMDAAELGERRWSRLRDLIDDAIEGHDAMARRRGILVDCEVDPLTEMHAVPGLPGKAFDAVIGNAVAYAVRGSTVRIESAEDGETDHGGLTITVSNRAERLSDAELSRLGEPFFRPDASRSSATGGSGLGIHIAHAIFRSQGCMPSIAMTDGVFRYTVTLPAAVIRKHDAEPDGTEPSDPAARPQTKPKPDRTDTEATPSSC